MPSTAEFCVAKLQTKSDTAKHIAKKIIKNQKPPSGFELRSKNNPHSTTLRILIETNETNETNQHFNDVSCQ